MARSPCMREVPKKNAKKKCEVKEYIPALLWNHCIHGALTFMDFEGPLNNVLDCQ